MWTYEDDLTILPNLIVRSKFKDGVLKFYQLYPCEGYVLRIQLFDEYGIDENGNRVLVNVYRTMGGAVVEPSYDWGKNPNGYVAEFTQA